MFGTDDNTQQSVNDPAMLDNVTQLAKEPASMFQATPVSSDASAVTAPQAPASVAKPWTGYDQTDDSANEDIAEDDSSEESDQLLDDTDNSEDADAPTPISDITPPPTAQSDDDQTPDDNSHTVALGQQVSTINSVIDIDKLASVKQQALNHLEPLVGKLNQTPEEEFRTTMMMIQANDNHTLIEKALHAAKNIKDDNERAQAMLDIVNEANYFTHQASEEE